MKPYCVSLLIVCGVGLFQSAAFHTLQEYHVCMQVLFVIVFFSLRNYSLLRIVNEQRETYPGEFHVYLIQSSVVDGMSHLVTQHFFIVRELQVNTTIGVLYVILSCFLFEIIYEFFHYWTHRFLHQKTMYAWFHKTHHKFWCPNAIHAFYQHPVDIIVSHSIPNAIAVIMLPNMYYVYYHCSTVYKQYVDICVHSNPESDHRLHHSVSKYNYGKSISLWDTMFRTYLYKNKNKTQVSSYLDCNKSI